jgi:hypothetical protein
MNTATSACPTTQGLRKMPAGYLTYIYISVVLHILTICACVPWHEREVRCATKVEVNHGCRLQITGRHLRAALYMQEAADEMYINHTIGLSLSLTCA